MNMKRKPKINLRHKHSNASWKTFPKRFKILLTLQKCKFETFWPSTKDEGLLIDGRSKDEGLLIDGRSKDEGLLIDGRSKDKDCWLVVDPKMKDCWLMVEGQNIT